MDIVESYAGSPELHGRRHRRFDLAFPVRIRLQCGATVTEIETISKNVGVGGLLVRSALPVPPHTSITLIISLHGNEAVRPVRLVAEGEVVRLDPNEGEGSFALALKCNSPMTQLEEYLPLQAS